jgi:hypothetical protein
LSDTCAGEVAKFIGKRGVFVSGRVKPAIEGVSITVTTVGAESEYVSIETDKKGEFK